MPTKIFSYFSELRKGMQTPIFSAFLSVFFVSTGFAETNIRNYLTDVNIQYIDSGIDKINCVYVINLENRPEKWIETKNALESYGIHPNRVNAINGWALNEKEKKALSGEYPVRMRGGSIGCILSHVSTLNDAHRKGYETIWVCEDDIQIYENPHQISDLISTLSEIDPQWDILYTDSDSKNGEGIIVPSLGSDFRLNFPHKDLSYYIKRESINEEMLKIHQRFGAYSMIVSKKGIEKILKHFMNNHLWTSYDIDIHYVLGIRQYCVRRDLVSINFKKHSDTVFDFTH